MLFTLVIAIGTFPYALRTVGIPWSLDQDSVHSEFVRLLFLQVHRETDRFFVSSGVLVGFFASSGVLVGNDFLHLQEFW
jgi:hypothetical protein